MRNLGRELRGELKMDEWLKNAVQNSDAMLRPPPPMPSAAERTYRNVKEYVRLFESRIPDGHQIGVRLAPFGILHIELIGYYNPDILTFEGVDENKERVLCIQHVSQLSMQLVAMKKSGEEPRRPIGFVHPPDSSGTQAE
jgi:hypothetical protein